MMLNVDFCLGLYGLVAAVITPRLLQRPGLTDRTPLLGVAAWLVAAATVVGSWLMAAMSLANHSEPLARMLGVAAVCGVLVSIGWASTKTLYATRKRRARHVQAARVLGRPDPLLGALIVESTALAAYCMPHAGGGLVVVTTATQSRLSHRQLRAVLAHEHEHLHGRHHLLLAIGQVLGRTLPWMRLCRRLVPEIARLLEMRADDVAARRYGAFFGRQPAGQRRALCKCRCSSLFPRLQAPTFSRPGVVVRGRPSLNSSAIQPVLR